MTVYVADLHEHLQRLVSVVKMATVLEECIIQEQRSVVRFLLWAMQRIFINKYFLFMFGKVVHTGVGNVSLMTKRLKRRCGSA
jgi:hypothetical protein